MKKVIYVLALFIFGTAAAQDSTFTRTVTTTKKKTERVVKKRFARVLPVATEQPFQSKDTVGSSAAPIRRDEESSRDVKVLRAKQ